MVPMQIYRSDVEEYYVEFTIEEIEKLHSRFMQTLSEGKGSLFNDEHNSSKVIPAYILHTWTIEDPLTDQAYTKYNIEAPKGTIMMMTKVVDTKMYNYLVENDMLGYSIEGFLGLKLSEIKKELELAEPPFHEGCKCEGDNPDRCDYCEEQMNMNETKNNKIEMSKNTLVPGEEYILGDKLFIFSEDGTLIEKKKEEEVELEVIEDEKKEEVVEEVKEELADEVIEDKVEEVKEEPVVSYSKEELDAKFEELYKIIADLKVGEEKVEEVKEEPAMFTIHDRFAAYSRFASENK
jgi:hypothetical protein